MMFGSDCPLHHSSVMLQRIRVMKLPAAQEEDMLWKTVARVYSLDLPGVG